MSVLLSWIGTTDLEENAKKGAICDILKDIKIDQLVLLYDISRYKKVAESGGFISNLKLKCPNLYIITKKVKIYHPNDMDSIYPVVEQVLYRNIKSKLYINISSGSGVMAACWMLAVDRIDTSKHNRPILLECSWQRGTRELPFPENEKRLGLYSNMGILN